MWVLSLVGKIPWRNQPTPVFLPGESCGQRSPAGHSPLGLNELDVTEHRQSPVIVYTRSLVTCTHTYVCINLYTCKHRHLYSICNVCVYICKDENTKIRLFLTDF